MKQKKKTVISFGKNVDDKFKQMIFLQLKRRRIPLKNISERFGITIRELNKICNKPTSFLDKHSYPTKLNKRLTELANKNISGRERTREIVRFRDNYTCQSCGIIRTPEMAKKEGKKQLDVHHLNGVCGKKSKGYDSVYSIDGLITLCHKCHFNHPEHTLKTRNK